MGVETLDGPVPDLTSPAEGVAAETITTTALQNVMAHAGVILPEDGLHHTTYEQHQAVADAAFDLAVERKRTHKLDSEATAYYDLAAIHIRGLLWTGPKQPLDAMNMMKLGGSLANLAEATGSRVRASSYAGEQAHLDELARRELTYAGELLMGERSQEIERLVSKMADSTSEKTEVMAAQAEEVVEQLTEEHDLAQIAY